VRRQRRRLQTEWWGLPPASSSISTTLLLSGSDVCCQFENLARAAPVRSASAEDPIWEGCGRCRRRREHGGARSAATVFRRATPPRTRGACARCGSASSSPSRAGTRWREVEDRLRARTFAEWDGDDELEPRSPSLGGTRSSSPAVSLSGSRERRVIRARRRAGTPSGRYPTVPRWVSNCAGSCG
jgi:hypothetical protein